MMTRQEIFDIVYTGLRNQGWHRSAHKEFCMYRSPDGSKCAFGHLIPDELYHPSFENKIATKLVFSTKVSSDVDYPALVKLRDWAKETFADESKFISDLQYLHDDGFYPEKMRMDFDDIAIQYELKIPD